MKEGGLDNPTRHAIAWHDPEFYDETALDTELRRVFDICHGCRRCFNLCDSFPRLFDLIDNSPTGELDEVKSADFKPVVDACTLCDMCYMTKCPYVPPHPFNLDFPHLMLRARAIEAKKGEISFTRPPTDRDRPQRPHRRPVRAAGQLGDRHVQHLYALHHGKAGRRTPQGASAALLVPHVRDSQPRAPVVHQRHGAGRRRKAVIYATCFVNYNNPGIGEAAQAVLEKNGVATEVVYPECCGMPQLEHGDLADVAGRAKRIATIMKPYIDKGYAIVALVPSCSLMLRSEWPLLVPDDPEIKALARATRDISEYVMDIAGKEGLAPGLRKIEDGSAWLQLACHARAQNVGAKAAEMLRLIPEFKVGVIERCSGHGGSWGILKENFEIGLKVGKPVARQVAEEPRGFVASECPLAADHIVQGATIIAEGDGKDGPARSHHPIEILAQAYGLKADKIR